ncbi:ACT domain-containing protein [Sphingomicrobium astaxanthinifaciens]|uniref:ACT domain-containing protein n=1 Tax=Sphingomicrobium astaxanthinifaciens TaxID=1227949 RepID=UPI001FCB1459|nr:ACT domain-containing protein [Sphingomicrobium astaxanthinifaciens]MCJ7421799.1 ACT domain-containing protein [Sphingomicrobium astaxanthinifaciens]
MSGLEPRLHPARFGIACLPDPRVPAGLAPFALVAEREGLTVVADHAALAAAGIEPGAPFALVSLGLASALDGVGLTAAFATALAAAGIACNTLAGYHHDHLLVPWERRAEALAILDRLEAP